MIPLIHGFIKINNFKHKKKTFSVVYVRYYNTICTPVKLCNDGERGCAMYVCSTVQDTRGGYLGRWCIVDWDQIISHTSSWIYAVTVAFWRRVTNTLSGKYRTRMRHISTLNIKVLNRTSFINRCQYLLDLKWNKYIDGQTSIENVFRKHCDVIQRFVVNSATKVHVREGVGFGRFPLIPHPPRK